MPAEIPVGDPDNVSSIVSYLVKPEASFITGQWRRRLLSISGRLDVILTGQAISPNGGAVFD